MFPKLSFYFHGVISDFHALTNFILSFLDLEFYCFISFFFLTRIDRLFLFPFPVFCFTFGFLLLLSFLFSTIELIDSILYFFSLFLSWSSINLDIDFIFGDQWDPRFQWIVFTICLLSYFRFQFFFLFLCLYVRLISAVKIKMDYSV